MDKKISIRKAEKRDIEPIKNILFAALKEYEIAVADNYPVSDIESIGDRTCGAKVFVLLSGRSVIGFAVLRPVDEDCIELKRLYLTPSARGRKLGAGLLKFAVGLARENNYKTMKLETTSRFEAAVSLYKKNGFKALETAEKAPGHDLVFELALLP